MGEPGSMLTVRAASYLEACDDAAKARARVVVAEERVAALQREFNAAQVRVAKLGKAYEGVLEIGERAKP